MFQTESVIKELSRIPEEIGVGKGVMQRQAGEVCDRASKATQQLLSSEIIRDFQRRWEGYVRENHHSVIGKNKFLSSDMRFDLTSGGVGHVLSVSVACTEKKPQNNLLLLMLSSV